MLYQKHRPKNLGEVVGNLPVVQSLTSLLQDREKTPHSFLFTGPSGCGKTTLARIVAQEVGAHSQDLQEVDSADFRGIDTVRDIRRQMSLRPLASACRVWIMDECHKMTNEAQNAMLKALEDTPSHVYFMLCTTDPQKLLPTIKNRCTEITVAPLGLTNIEKIVRAVARAEGVRLSKEVREYIATASLGSARAALVLLERVIWMPPEDMLKAAESVARKQSSVIDLCRMLIAMAPWPEVTPVLKALEAQGEDPESIRRAVLGYFHAVLMGGDRPWAWLIMDIFTPNTYDMGWPAISKACYEALTHPDREKGTDDVPF